MSELPTGVILGAFCSICLNPFADENGECFEHGYLAVCKDCWETLSTEEKEEHQRATADTI